MTADSQEPVLDRFVRAYQDYQRELEEAVETMKDASKDSDPKAFAKIMEQEKAYFEGWSR